MTKKITLVAVLIAFAAIISIFDSYFSFYIFSLIPFLSSYAHTLKLGLANIVILYLIYNIDLKSAVTAVLLKSVIISLIYGSFLTFMIGFSGTILSFLVTIGLKHVLKEDKYIIFISSVSAFMHMVGQIGVVCIIYNFNYTDLLLYAPLLLIISLISGAIVGVISKALIRLKI